MIPNFKTYNIINESISLQEIKKNRKSYGYVKRDLSSKGYEDLGNITFESRRWGSSKYNEVLDVIPDELLDKFNKEEAAGFVSGIPIKSAVSVSIWGCDDKSRILSVLKEQTVENVIACITQKGDLYYCLYSDEKKYFYYATSKKSTQYVSGYNSPLGFLELFVKVRTSSVEEVSNELESYYDEYRENKKKEEEERLRREEEERLRKEKEEEKRRIKKEKEEAYQKRVDVIKADVEENPENYEMVSMFEGLPEEIRKEVNSDDYMDSKYAEYILHGKWDPYDRETIVVYVNDDNLTKGYKYISSIDHSRPGTYWGD